MTTSDNTSQQLAEDLAKSLQSTTTLVQTLLTEIRNNAGTLGTLEAKLQALNESVSSLSAIVRDGNGKGSVITRLALTEKDLKDLEDTVKDLSDNVIRLYNKIESKLDAKAVELHERISKVKGIVVEKEEEEKSETQYNREKTLNVLKLTAQVLPGLIALGVVIAKYFFGVE